jgi:hypothetical protein
MIDLSSEPSLGTLILSKDGSLKYSYVLPRGMTFPTGSEATIAFSDRAGGTYNIGDYKYGSMSDDLTTFTWVIGSVLTNQVVAGDNFEVFVNVDGDSYKVRYGRVVRKQVSYPLNPITVTSPPLFYEDDMQRNVPGPRWLAKYGGVSMNKLTFGGGNTSFGSRYVMGARYQADIFGNSLSLFSKASVLWYAPMRTDSVDISVKVASDAANRDGECFIVFASNSSMTRWLAVRISDPSTGWTRTADNLQVVAGFYTAEPPTFDALLTNYTPAISEIGSFVNYDTPYYNQGTANTFTYRVVYDGALTNPSPSVSVYTPASTTTPALTTSLTSSGFISGAGYRYCGLMFNSSIATAGPRVFSWKAKDTVL